MVREKYPESCPWDLGPRQKRSEDGEWTLVNGSDFVKFSRNQDNHHWFNINRNNEIFEQYLAYKARLTYQKLLDKGYKLKGKG